MTTPPHPMGVLIDTNLLTRIAEPAHPHHAAAFGSVRRLLASGEAVHIVPQNLYEFWAVATRPVASNGLGMTVQQAMGEVDALRGVLTVLPDAPAIVDEWLRLIVAYDCKGKPSHDARLVAAMKTHNLGQILTFNGQDFTRFSGITVLDPMTLSQP